MIKVGSLEELSEISEVKLRSYTGLGNKSINEIKDVLEKVGLSLAYKNMVIFVDHPDKVGEEYKDGVKYSYKLHSHCDPQFLINKQRKTIEKLVEERDHLKQLQQRGIQEENELREQYKLVHTHLQDLRKLLLLIFSKSFDSSQPVSSAPVEQ